MLLICIHCKLVKTFSFLGFQVPEAERLGVEEPLEKRVDLLVETTCYVVFAYIAQVCPWK
jgi:hypothetical protein